MMKKIFLFGFLILFSFNAICHSGKAKYHVIIDTDAALDDMRAISMMLASNEFEVLAITTCDGLLSADDGLKKVRALLKTYGHEGVQTAMGRNCNRKNIPCRNFLKGVFWGDENNISNKSENTAAELIINSIKNEEEKVTLVCLGPLTNIAEVVKKDKEIFSKIDKIFWYCDGETGLNYKFNKAAADIIINSEISLFKISSEGDQGIFLSDKIVNKFSKINSKYSRHISIAHNNAEVRELIKSNCLKLWDDLVPVFMLNPNLFFVEKANHFINNVKCIEIEKVKTKIFELLAAKNKESIVFEQFPLDTALFSSDVQQYMETIIENHGYSEWRAGVLTNELHGHLGIYSIIGTKMGLRAREYFDIGVDEIKILSFAGKQPPLSCLNDGLQVSTGATIGHGLIEISDNEICIPLAIFTFKNRSIKITLKQKYKDIIKQNILEGIKENGKLTEEYWKYIRKLALQYWANLSRNEIFNLTVIK